jgi:hypothetical protein
MFGFHVLPSLVRHGRFAKHIDKSSHVPVQSEIKS